MPPMPAGNFLMAVVPCRDAKCIFAAADTPGHLLVAGLDVDAVLVQVAVELPDFSGPFEFERARGRSGAWCRNEACAWPTRPFQRASARSVKLRDRQPP